MGTTTRRQKDISVEGDPMADTFGEAEFGITASDESTGIGDEGGLTFDFSGVNENSYGELWTPGVYDGTVVDSTFSYSQASNNPMITLKIEARNEDTGKSRPFYTHLVFSEGGLPRVKRTLSRLDPVLVQGPFNPSRDARRLVGLPCQVKIVSKPYEGQMRNEVKEVLPAAADDDNGIFGR